MDFLYTDCNYLLLSAIFLLTLNHTPLPRRNAAGGQLVGQIGLDMVFPAPLMFYYARFYLK